MTVHVRAATPADLDALVALEHEAGQLFRTVGLAEVAAHDPDLAALQRGLERGRLWAAEEDGTVVGYVAATVLDGNAHVEQVSVAPRRARRGIGAGLIRHVENWGRSWHSRATTLTTFRDVPWNAPYYARLGYAELPGGLMGPELAAVMARETAMPGLDPGRRCAMVRDNPTAG